jgi:hypothetical protein
MKEAEVKKLKFRSAVPSMEEISDLMDLQEPLSIETLNWKEFGYKPEVFCSIAYGDDEIYLKYYVKEDHFKAEMTESNQSVCQDSCVEFFVSPSDDGVYYNFEFNGIGTCLLGNGTSRADSKKTDPGLISRIRRLATPGKGPIPERHGEFRWSITVAIPLDVFFRHKVKDLRGKVFRANFYKCGDMLTEPHYVTWNPVGTEKPDYHRPEHFGLLRFV